MATTTINAFARPESYPSKCDLLNSKSTRVKCLLDSAGGHKLHIRMKEIPKLSKWEKATVRSLIDGFTSLYPRYCRSCIVFLFKPELGDWANVCDSYQGCPDIPKGDARIDYIKNVWRAFDARDK
jgi:hypothetical protein